VLSVVVVVDTRGMPARAAQGERDVRRLVARLDLIDQAGGRGRRRRIEHVGLDATMTRPASNIELRAAPA